MGAKMCSLLLWRPAGCVLYLRDIKRNGVTHRGDARWKGLGFVQEYLEEKSFNASFFSGGKLKTLGKFFADC